MSLKIITTVGVVHLVGIKLGDFTTNTDLQIFSLVDLPRIAKDTYFHSTLLKIVLEVTLVW